MRNEDKDCMGRLSVDIMELEEMTLYGLWKGSNDKTVSSDIDFMSKEYHEAVGRRDGEILPYFVLSRNYDKQCREFELLVGSTLEHENLERLILPQGPYARITVSPRFGRWWGMAIGEAKRYFYTKWLPGSPYEALNLEYEYHTQKSKDSHPSIDIMFAVRKKEKE